MPNAAHRFNTSNRSLTRWALASGCAVVATFTGCAPPKPDLVAPRALVAPYSVEQGEVLWAVLPLRNESGTTLIDSVALTDKLIGAAEQIRGVRVVPLNRVLQAMTTLKLNTVTNTADAKRIGDALGVDAVLVGSITAYDPYTPTIGLALGLFGNDAAMGAGAEPSPTPQALSNRTVDSADRSGTRGKPLSTASQMFDGKSHETQMQVRQFAMGRSEDTTALAWRRYLASSELFGEFVSYQILDDLVRAEWLRTGVARPTVATAQEP